jgi:hypothetical protein
VPGITKKITETTVITVNYSTTNHQAVQYIQFRPSDLMQASRLTAYQGLYEQYITGQSRVTFTPVLPMTAGGILVMYIDRNPGDSVGDYLSGMTEREKVVSKVTQRCRQVFNPHSAYELATHSIDPGNSSNTQHIVRSSQITAYDATELADGVTIGFLTYETDFYVIGQVAFT